MTDPIAPPNYGLDCPIQGDASGLQLNPVKMAKQIRKVMLHHMKRKPTMPRRSPPRRNKTKWY